MQAEQSMGEKSEAGGKANSFKLNQSSWSRQAAQNSLSHLQNMIIKGKQRVFRYLENCKQAIWQFGERLHVGYSLFNHLETTSHRERQITLQIITSLEVSLPFPLPLIDIKKKTDETRRKHQVEANKTTHNQLSVVNLEEILSHRCPEASEQEKQGLKWCETWGDHWGKRVKWSLRR